MDADLTVDIFEADILLDAPEADAFAVDVEDRDFVLDAGDGDIIAEFTGGGGAGVSTVQLDNAVAAEATARTQAIAAAVAPKANADAVAAAITAEAGARTAADNELSGRIDAEAQARTDAIAAEAAARDAAIAEAAGDTTAINAAIAAEAADREAGDAAEAQARADAIAAEAQARADAIAAEATARVAAIAEQAADLIAQITAEAEARLAGDNALNAAIEAISLDWSAIENKPNLALAADLAAEIEARGLADSALNGLVSTKAEAADLALKADASALALKFDKAGGTVTGLLKAKGGFWAANADESTVFSISQDATASYINSQKIIPGVGYGNASLIFSAADSLFTADAAGYHKFRVGGTDRMSVHATGASLVGNLDITGELTVTSTRTAGTTPQVLFNVAKAAAQGSVFGFRRPDSTTQVLVGFETGAGVPDGYFGTKIGTTNRVYFLGGSGTGGAFAIDAAAGLMVGTSTFSAANATISPAGAASFGGNLELYGLSGTGARTITLSSADYGGGQISFMNAAKTYTHGAIGASAGDVLSIQGELRFINRAGTIVRGNWTATGLAITGPFAVTGNIDASGNVTVANDPYGAGWNGSLAVPTKDAVFDKIEAVIATIPAGGGGSAAWTLIGTVTPTVGATSVLFDNIPATYSDLLIVVEGISHSSGSNQGFRLEFSADSATFSNATLFTPAAPATALFYGSVLIPGYRKNAGATLGLANNLAAADPGTGTQSAAQSVVWRCTGGIKAIRITPGSAGYDAGTITLFAR